MFKFYLSLFYYIIIFIFFFNIYQTSPVEKIGYKKSKSFIKKKNNNILYIF